MPCHKDRRPDKRYGLPLPGFMTGGMAWLRGLVGPGTGKKALPDKPWALEDISFEVKKGETLA
jgi:hypothetical protein